MRKNPHELDPLAFGFLGRATLHTKIAEFTDCAKIYHEKAFGAQIDLKGE
jgi:hypothetical protein